MKSYAISLPMKFRSRWLSPESAVTTRISTKLLYFTTDDDKPTALEDHQLITTAIDWPVALDDGTPLTLFFEGRICLTDWNRIRMEVTRYCFKTRRRT